MTTAPDNAPAMAVSGNEPQVKYLSPTPPGLHPEIDYLATLQSICKAAGLGPEEPSTAFMYNDVEDIALNRNRKGCFRSGPRIRIIDSSASLEWLIAGNIDLGVPGEVETMYSWIRQSRQVLVDETQSGTRVMIIDRIDKPVLQVLGAALDLDPTFLIRYANQDKDLRRLESKLTTLRTNYFSLIAGAKRRRGDPDADGRNIPLSPMETDGIHTDACFPYGDEEGPDPRQIFSCISFCKVSANGWLILADCTTSGAFDRKWLLPTPFAHRNMLSYSRFPIRSVRLPLDVGPIHKFENSHQTDGLSTASYALTSEMTQTGPRYNYTDRIWPLLASKCFDVFDVLCDLLASKSSVLNTTKAESKATELDLLFGKRDDEFLAPEVLFEVLPWLLAISVWRSNIKAFDRRLKRLSYEAMTHPSLKTFRPIPMLRANVADLQDALEEIRDGIDELDRAAFSVLQKRVEFRLESLDAVFETLLKQAESLSLAASNEIQLVIGSVTIQDSDLMKRQSQRATLLTLLAAFYLPLSLVTGIFGMNVKELQDANPSFVVCFEALFAVLAVTMVFYGLYRCLPFTLRAIWTPLRRLPDRWSPIVTAGWREYRAERRQRRERMEAEEEMQYKLA